MSAIETTYADRPEWLQARRQGLGASDAAALFGESPWQSPMALWAEKRGLTVHDEANVPEFIKWGLRLEPVIAKHFGEETQREVIDVPPYTISYEPTLPILMATLDRKQRDFLAPKSVGVLELKSTNQFMKSEWSEGAPLYYQIQAQHQMMVTGLAFASIAVLIAGAEFLWLDVPRHEDFIRELRQKCIGFWGLVVAGTAPPPDAHRATRDALHRMFPKEQVGEMVALPIASAAWDEQRQKGKQLEKDAKLMIDEAEAHLKLSIGDNVGGVVPGVGASYTWKWQQKKSYVVAAQQNRILRRKGE